MIELKPCPFCGEIPIVEVIARFPRSGKDEGKRIKGYTVVCQNLDCILHNADNWYRRSGKKACEAWNHRAEPENRPLTLEEAEAHCAKGPDAEPLWVEFREKRAISRWIFAAIPPDVFDRPVISDWMATGMREEYGKECRCWPRKPTQEQMAAEKWEE